MINHPNRSKSASRAALAEAKLADMIGGAEYALSWLVRLEKAWENEPDRNKKCSTNEAAVAAGALRTAIAKAKA